jgi:hypothetical protein
MPWKASSVMEERLRFVARLLDGEAMTDVCRDFGVSRKTDRRSDAIEATVEDWAPNQNKPPAMAGSESFDPIGLIERLVQDAVAQRVTHLASADVASLAPAISASETRGPKGGLPIARAFASRAHWKNSCALLGGNGNTK